MSMKKYVVIGNGIAAVGCVEGIRSADRAGMITIVSAETHPAYFRPLISYYLEGKSKPENLPCRQDGFYESNGCTVLYGRRALSLDPERRRVKLDDGEELSYDALCIAAGSSPFVPKIDGMDEVRQRFCFLTWDDALALEQAVTPQSRVLIVGAGLIGLKCAEGLHNRVESIAVCDLAPRVLSSVLDEESAAMMQAHLERSGIRFLLEDSVKRVRGNTAFLQSGAEIPFDVLVLAVGVRPNCALVRDAGGACGRAVTVDSHMRTSLAGIYAAGDCTESTDRSDGTVKIMALLPNAYRQGRCVGVNMAGGEAVLDDTIPMNAVGFFGLHALTAGSRFAPEVGGKVFAEHTPDSIKKLFTRNGRLTGFILVGNAERAGIYTSLIRSGTPLNSIDFEKMKKRPDLSVFDAKKRRNMLGGVV